MCSTSFRNFVSCDVSNGNGTEMRSALSTISRSKIPSLFVLNCIVISQQLCDVLGRIMRRCINVDILQCLIHREVRPQS